MSHRSGVVCGLVNPRAVIPYRITCLMIDAFALALARILTLLVISGAVLLLVKGLLHRLISAVIQ